MTDFEDDGPSKADIEQIMNLMTQSRHLWENLRDNYDEENTSILFEKLSNFMIDLFKKQPAPDIFQTLVLTVASHAHLMGSDEVRPEHILAAIQIGLMHTHAEIREWKDRTLQ